MIKCGPSDRLSIWLPYVVAGTGSDTWTRLLADGLRERGHQVTLTGFAHWRQYVPWSLRRQRPGRQGQPPDDQGNGPYDVVLTNSWNGFAFRDAGRCLVTVVHLCVHDPALRPYKSFAQAVFHRLMVLPFERASVKAADLTIAVAESAVPQVERWYRPTALMAVPNAVDTATFCPPASPPRTADGSTTLSLLFVGSLSQRKGADLLPQIMDRLEGRARLSIVTQSPETELAAHPAVRWLGTRRGDALLSAYREADALLFPSRLEGLPYVPMEAMACGLPVIGSDIPSLAEIVPHGRTGLLCPPGDVAAFTHAADRLHQDPALLHDLSRQAREHATQALDQRLWLDRLEQALLALKQESAQ